MVGFPHHFPHHFSIIDYNKIKVYSDKDEVHRKPEKRKKK